VNTMRIYGIPVSDINCRLLIAELLADEAPEASTWPNASPKPSHARRRRPRSSPANETSCSATSRSNRPTDSSPSATP
jgi:hypothetical protein